MSLKHLLLPFLLCLAAGATAATAEQRLYAKPTPVAIENRLDRTLADDWKRNGIALPREASDSVMVRRLYLDLAGRLPTADEARAYVNSKAPDKRTALIDKLLVSNDFFDYWTMHWCDILRVKSEFPINLWPNAVYGYQRRVRQFLSTNEPYDDFARALLTANGSNFRVPEVNFYRATADRTPAGLAKAAALTFLGIRLEKLPEKEQQTFTAFFEQVGFKNTKEWKEEIVYLKKRVPPHKVTLPGGMEVMIPDSGDPRAAFAEAAVAHPYFARALVNRVWYWLVGRGIVNEADDLRADNPPVNPELLDELADGFVKSGYDFRQLCRRIVNSAAYRTASGNGAKAERHFASYTVRRLDAEVLDDAIRDLSGTPSKYSSVIPEPFTFIPPEARTITLADGSISGSFLILFGRPARDSGTLDERNDAINSSQRLKLFNSGELYRRLGRVLQRPELRKLPFPRKLEELYWMFYSRPPTDDEADTILNAHRHARKKWNLQQDICWILLNSREFLYRH